MTLQLHKKRQTTPRNTQQAISPSVAQRMGLNATILSAVVLSLLFSSADATAATSSPSSKKLQWARPSAARKSATPKPKAAKPKAVMRQSTVAKTTVAQNAMRQQDAPAQGRKSFRLVRRDMSVVLAAWDEEDARQEQLPLQHASTAQQPVPRHEGVVRQKTVLQATVQQVNTVRQVNFEEVAQVDFDKPETAHDPFESDNQQSILLAQLPDDPFDEPSDESLPAPESETDLETIENALEDEIKRRQSESDIFEEEEESQSPPDRDLSDEDPLESLQEDDSFSDEYEDKNKMQRGSGSKSFDLDYGYRDDLEEPELTPEELEQRRLEFQERLQENEENCQQELLELEADKISTVDLTINLEGQPGEDFPYECKVGNKVYEPRQWEQITYHWKAAALCHKPLYFEQVQLERYGHSWGPLLQPIMSGVHFFGSVPILPYKMGIRTPTECVYTLGYYRPGSCAPYLIDPIPFTWRAALFQGTFSAGFAVSIP